MALSSTASRGDRDTRAILDSIRHIVRLLRLSARDAERRAGVSAAQLFVLHQLRDRDGLSLGDLAGRTFTDPSSVSVVVSRLVEKGYVERVRASDDARKIALALTAEGRRALRRSPDPAQDRFVTAIGALAGTKRKTLAALLREVVAQLGIVGEPELFFEEGTAPRSAAGRTKSTKLAKATRSAAARAKPSGREVRRVAR